MKNTKSKCILLPIMIDVDDKNAVISLKMPTYADAQKALKQQFFSTDKDAWDYLTALVE